MGARKFIETPAEDMRFFENGAYRRGFQFLAGIDEVGRGPLAGPVVAAAVILPRGVALDGVTDSKRLDPGKREDYCDKIISCAIDVGIGAVEAPDIDRINILQATFQAMNLALQRLRVTPDFLLIDGPYRLSVPILQQGIPQGDQRSISIAAASIVAKVHRDRLMNEYHRLYPVYGFDRNKGYGTAPHLEALKCHGPCPLHRLTFRGVIHRDEAPGKPVT